MTRQRNLSLALCAMALGILFAFVLSVTGMQGEQALALALPKANEPQVLTPTLVALSPSEAPNNLDATLTLTGTNFRAVLSGTEVLTAPVPWGLDAGVYTVTVTNPDGGAGWLTNAFTVEQAIGVWTTSGPYGGQIYDLAVSPAISRTAFAAVWGTGLYRTQNGGDHWDLVIPDPAARGTRYGPPPTSTLYYWGTGLHASHDGGETWTEIAPGMIQTMALDPSNEERLWIVDGDRIHYSPDGGTTWEVRDTGLPANTDPMVLAVSPADPSLVLAGLNDGQLFKTTDAGLGWAPVTEGLPGPNRVHEAISLAFNPFAPHIVIYSRLHDRDAALYRSTDAGDTWSAIPSLSPDGGFVSDLAFAPAISGTVYASMMGPSLAASYDGGLTWTRIHTGTLGGMYSVGLDPQSQRPAYLGSWDKGVYRSHDGGWTWVLATEGIAALLVSDIEAVPGRPEMAYVACEGVAVFATEDAGASWRQRVPPEGADPTIGGGAAAVAADPQRPMAIYVGSGGVPPEICRNPDGGDVWERIQMPIVESGMIEALAVSPISPSLLYAGGMVGDFEDERGLLFHSDDYGATWTELAFGRQISMVSDIVVDPVDDQKVYVSTTRYDSPRNNIPNPGLGIFRSEDGGTSWTSAVSGIGHYPIWSLAIDPHDPDVLYAGGWLPSTEQSAVFKSTDGGNSWTVTSLRIDGREIGGLAVDPSWSADVYAGTDGGLFVSHDGGLTWSQASGSLGEVWIHRLDIASDDKRTILYVGTFGGFVSGTNSSPRSMSGGFVQGGVYQQTIDHRRRPTIYLPLVAREN